MPAPSAGSSSPWQAPPAQLELEPGWGHIFRFHLDPPAGLDCRPGILSLQEQVRAERFITGLLRSRFRAAHVMLRQVLAAYLRREPGQLRFGANEYGKPFLSGENRLQFNLSHSQGIGLLAVCDRQAAGIDIEEQHEHIDRDAIARRFFAPGEYDAINCLPEPERLAAFLACWTRKEAYIKARGMGLSIPLDSFEVSVAPGSARLYERLPESIPSQAFSLYEIDPGPGFSAALAVEGQLNGLRCWDWPLISEQ